MNGVFDRTGDFEISQQGLRALSFVKRDPAPRLKTYSFNDDGFRHAGIVGKVGRRVKLRELLRPAPTRREKAGAGNRTLLLDPLSEGSYNSAKRLTEGGHG